MDSLLKEEIKTVYQDLANGIEHSTSSTKPVLVDEGAAKDKVESNDEVSSDEADGTKMIYEVNTKVDNLAIKLEQMANTFAKFLESEHTKA